MSSGRDPPPLAQNPQALLGTRRAFVSKARVARWLGIPEDAAVNDGPEVSFSPPTVYSIAPSGAPLAPLRMPGSVYSGPIPTKGLYLPDESDLAISSEGGSEAGSGEDDGVDAASAAEQAVSDDDDDLARQLQARGGQDPMPATLPVANGTAQADVSAVLLAGRPLYVHDHVLLVNTQRRALLAEDGAVMHLANPATNPQPFQGLIPEPHIVSGTGHPYHATSQGLLFPILLTPSGRPYLGPSGRPLLLGSPECASDAAVASRLGPHALAAAGRGGSADSSSLSSLPAGSAAWLADAARRVVVWPLLTCSGKGAALTGACGEPLGLAALPEDFPLLAGTVTRVLAAGGDSAAATAAASVAATALRDSTASTVVLLPTGCAAAGVPALPVLVCLASGEPLMGADGNRLDLSPDGLGFVSASSGKRAWSSDGRPLQPRREHKTVPQRLSELRQSLGEAWEDDRLAEELQAVIRRYRRRGQGHVVLQAGLLLVALAAAAVAAWLLLLLPLCWAGLAGEQGHQALRWLLAGSSLVIGSCCAAVTVLALRHGQLATARVPRALRPKSSHQRSRLWLPGSAVGGSDLTPNLHFDGPASHDRRQLLDNQGWLLLSRGSKHIEVMLGPNGRPLPSSTGLPLAPLATAPDGTPMAGPDGPDGGLRPGRKGPTLRPQVRAVAGSVRWPPSAAVTRPN